MSWRTTGAALALAAGVWACSDNSPNGLVDLVAVEGIPAGDSAYVGQEFFVIASTYDEDHNLVTRAPLSWSVADTGILLIEPNESQAYVRALRAGQTRLTIRADGATFTSDIRVREVPVVSITVNQLEPAGYAGGGTLQLTATVVDAFGTIRPDKTVSWQSSDPDRASVSSTGVVTYKVAGSATITASSEGVEGMVVVLVLPKPVLDLSQVTTEWTGYQGNASHTGYVPAVLDPTRFSTRWSVQVTTGGTGLNPPAIGGGRIYASNTAYFGTQILKSLDPATGAVGWTKSFGEIHSVDPPTYDNGSVYVATGGHGDSFIYGFDAATGNQRFKTPYGNQWSRWMAPVVVGSSLYMAGGTYGGMYAFNTNDGSQRWFLGLNQYDNFSPAVRNGKVYAYTGSYNPEVTVADAGTGAAVDHIADSAFNWNGWSMDASPVLGSGENLLSTQSGRLVSFDLTNKRIGWVVSGGSYSGQLALADGVIYVQNGTTIDARRESDGTLIWSTQMPTGTRGALLVTRNLLLGSTETTTWAIDLAAHRLSWSHPEGGHIMLTKDGLLLIAGYNGKLTALDVN